MDRKDFMLYMGAFPFLGAFVALILANIIHTGQAAFGIMVMLGIIGGYMGLLTYIVGLKYLGIEVQDNDSDQS